MKVVLVSTFGPLDACFDTGELREALERSGNRTEHFAFPLPEDRLGDQLAAFRFVDVPNADRLIAVTAMAAVIAHPAKVIWLLDDNFSNPALTDALFREARAIFTTTPEQTEQLAQRRIRAMPLPVPISPAGWANAVERLLA